MQIIFCKHGKVYKKGIRLKPQENKFKVLICAEDIYIMSSSVPSCKLLVNLTLPRLPEVHEIPLCEVCQSETYNLACCRCTIRQMHCSW